MNFSCLRYIKFSSTVDISTLLESKHQVVKLSQSMQLNNPNVVSAKQNIQKLKW